MTIRHGAQMSLLAVTCVIAGQSTIAQQPAPAAPSSAAPASAVALSAAIPDDPAITTGRFANGLRYYIRTNKKPEKRAELRLVVNAGSILEDDDQQRAGALRRAHGVQRHEELSEAGDREVPRVDRHAVRAERERVHELRRDGLHAPGADRQAGRPRQGVPDPRGLGAQRLVRSGGDRQGARRRHRGMAAAAAAPARACTTSSSRCCSRARATPSGCRSATTEIIETFKHDRLKQFYTDWYRPDLMAVVAVGDFDKAAIEALIKEHFGSIPASPRDQAAARSYDVPDHPGTLYTIATDKEASCTSVTVYSKMPLRDPTTVGVVPAADGRAAVQRHAVRAVLGDRAEAGRAVPRRERRARAVRPDEGSVDAERAREGGRDRARARGAVHRSRARRALRLHRDRARPRRSATCCAASSRRWPRRTTSSRRRSPTSTSRNFTQREADPRHRVRSGAAPAVPAGDHAGRGQRAGARTWMPDGNRVVLVSAPQKDGRDDARRGGARPR